MATFAILGITLTGCTSNSRQNGEQYAENGQNEEQYSDNIENNAPASFTSKQDVLDYVLDCWWIGDDFKILISENAGLKFQRAGRDSPLVNDLDYIEVRRFEGSEAVIEYSYYNFAAGRQKIRSEVNLTDGTLTYGINTLHKENNDDSE